MKYPKLLATMAIVAASVLSLADSPGGAVVREGHGGGGRGA